MEYIDDKLLKNISTALLVTGNIKKLLDAPFTGFITDIIPGEWDDELRFRLQKILSMAAFDLGVVDRLQSGLKTDDAEAIKKLVTYIHEQKDKGQESYLIKLAALICRSLDMRHAQSIYDAAVQLQYSVSKLP